MYKKKTNEEKLENFRVKSNLKFNNKYDYTKSEYVSAKTKILIICPIHGEFHQSPNNHMTGFGCIKCGRDKLRKHFTKPLDVFMEEFATLNLKNLHIYPETYKNSKSNLKLKCIKHDTVFYQTPDSILNAKSLGCKKCNGSNISKAEKEIVDYIKSLNISVIENDRSTIAPLELDILIPTHNIAIEYCGLYWHTERSGKTKNYHHEKYLKCKNNNIKLLTVFEDEWIIKKDQVKRKIAHELNKTLGERIYARKTVICKLSTKEKKEFFDNNHIQGNGPSSINIGLKHENMLVACMGFIKTRNGHYILSRYSTCNHVIGGFSKLLKYFQINYDWKSITSFADLRWSNGNLYEQTGWNTDKILKPDYYYLHNHKRYHKFNFRRKNLKTILGDKFDDNKSEFENCKDNKIYRIWDCGKIKYSLIN